MKSVRARLRHPYKILEAARTSVGDGQPGWATGLGPYGGIARICGRAGHREGDDAPASGGERVDLGYMIRARGVVVSLPAGVAALVKSLADGATFEGRRVDAGGFVGASDKGCAFGNGDA